MITIISPPKVYIPNGTDLSIFLAGSIEMGLAAEWQKEIIRKFQELEDDLPNITILNPRREDWDSSWTQSTDNPEFVKQVTWELKGLDLCDISFFYFEPNTLSPITLLELGKMSEKGKTVYVICPDGYWKKGNVDITSFYHNLCQFDTLEEAFKDLYKYITQT